jgi:hypothetical protein
MTILDVVARGAFEKSEKSALSGRAHDTNQTKPRISLGTIAQAGAVGGSLVIGAAAAVIAFRKRDEIETKFRDAMRRFLRIDDATRVVEAEQATAGAEAATDKELIENMLARIARLEETMHQRADDLVELINAMGSASEEAVADATTVQTLAAEYTDDADAAMLRREGGRETNDGRFNDINDKFHEIEDKMEAMGEELRRAVLAADDAVGQNAKFQLAAESADAATEASEVAMEKVSRWAAEFSKTYEAATMELENLKATVAQLGLTVAEVDRAQRAALGSQSAHTIAGHARATAKPPGKPPPPKVAKTPAAKWHNFGGRPYV